MTNTDTKDMILKKTFQLLLVKGYDGVSISDIQKATGMARGLLYHYFGSKETLFVEVTRKYFMNLFLIDLNKVSSFDMKAMIAHMEEKYDDVFLRSWEEFEQEPGVGIMNYDFLFYRVMQENKEFATEYLKARDVEVKAWTIVLENEARQGQLREDVNTVDVAQYFVYLLDGIWMNAVNTGDAKGLVREMGVVISGFYKFIKR